MPTRANRSHRILTISTVVALSLVAMVTTDLTSSAPVGAAANPASADWFTENYGDPMDFNNPEDFDTTPGFQAVNGASGMGSGQLQIVGSSQVFFLRADPGSFPMAAKRDPRARLLDSGRYNHLAFRMHSNINAAGAWSFKNCFAPGCADGTRYFQILAGWNDYDLDMGGPGPHDISGLAPTAGTPWSGYIHQMWLSPGFNSATKPTLTFEDFRIIHPGTASTIPTPRILAPSEGGGSDWVTDASGDPWDFNAMGDVSATTNVNFSTSGDEGHGSSAGPTINDPSISLNLHGRTIDAALYHKVSFTVRYDGTWGLADAPGQGMNARLMWHIAGQPAGSYQISDDFVVTPQKTTYSVDLKTWPPNAILDPAGNPNPQGWGAGGSTVIDELRFDPHEDRGARSWHIDDFRLLRNENANPGLAIRWIDDSWTAGTRAKIFIDADRVPWNGQTQIADVATTAGENAFNWDSTAVAAGTYFVRIVQTNTSGAEGVTVSTGQLDVGAGGGITPAAIDWAALIAYINAINWMKFVAFIKAYCAPKRMKVGSRWVVRSACKKAAAPRRARRRR